MSIKTFLHNILAGISHIWAQIVSAEKKAVHVGVQITEAIKNFDAQSPGVLDIVTSLIPGNIDDLIKEKMRAAIPEVFKGLKLVEGSANDLELVKNSIIALGAIKGLKKSVILNDIAIFLTNAAADGKLNWDDLAYLPKWYYDHDYKENNGNEAEVTN